MNCICCGKTIKKGSVACYRCATRIRTWGLEGTRWIYGLVESNRNTSRKELINFIETYYIEKAQRDYRIADLIKSIKKLGYTGSINNYPNKLNKSIEGIRKREHIRSRRMMAHINSCQICGKGNQRLECHHIVPVRLGGKSIKKNVIKLCCKCHRSIHRNMSKLLLEHFESTFEFMYSLLYPLVIDEKSKHQWH